MKHIPVLLDEVMAMLAPTADGIYLDGTFGGGGYSRRILQSGCTLCAIDRDPARGAFFAEIVENVSQFRFGQEINQIGRGFPRRAHSHIQRTIKAKTETTGGIIDLER